MTYIKDRDEPIYTISIAAKLVRPHVADAPGSSAATKPIHAQTLRMYDRLGLVKPQKVGKNRFYSDRDIERLQKIQHYTQDVKINLAGVTFILAMIEQMQQLDAAGDRLDAILRYCEQQVRELDERSFTKNGDV